MDIDRPSSGTSHNRPKSPSKGIFIRFLASGEFSDFVIKASSGREFKTHKIILAANSHYFDTLFKNVNTKEVMEGRVTLDDVSETTIETILNWTYLVASEELYLSIDDVTEDLVLFVDRFMMHPIRKMIETELEFSQSVESICKMARFAAILRNEKFFNAIAVFFKQNKAEVMKTEGYKIMCRGHPELAIKLLEECIEDDKNQLQDAEMQISTRDQQIKFWRERNNSQWAQLTPAGQAILQAHVPVQVPFLPGPAQVPDPLRQQQVLFDEFLAMHYNGIHMQVQRENAAAAAPNIFVVPPPLPQQAAIEREVEPIEEDDEDEDEEN